jgi:hypothetical protein
MTLQNWRANGWLRPHETTRQEISDLLQIVDRDLVDARKDMSADWQFGIAYNAALKLCTVLLSASGYRAERNLQHYRTLQALPLILGDERQEDADYLDACRVKRNQAEYDRVGVVSQGEAEELIGFVEEFRETVLRWLQVHHKSLIS